MSDSFYKNQSVPGWNFLFSGQEMNSARTRKYRWRGHRVILRHVRVGPVEDVRVTLATAACVTSLTSSCLQANLPLIRRHLSFSFEWSTYSENVWLWTNAIYQTHFWKEINSGSRSVCTKHCHVVCVTIDGVLDNWILEHLQVETTNNYTTIADPQFANY
jgi:hypothetical protein